MTAGTRQPDPEAIEPRLILASASPRRLELLQRFYPAERIQVIVPEYDETPLMVGPATDGPEALVRRLARGKLDALVHQHRLPDRTLALAADTIVTIDGRMLGKPVSPADAADMLRRLSGRTHQVMTGIAIRIADGGRILQHSVAETTDVTFGPLDEAMINWYLASGEPYDKAGAYGIQGLGAAFISRIDGSFYNVMGLPVHRLFVTLAEMARDTGSDQMRSFILPYAGRTPLNGGNHVDIEPDHPEHSRQSDHSERPRQPDQSDQPDEPNHPDQFDQPD